MEFSLMKEKTKYLVLREVNKANINLKQRVLLIVQNLEDLYR